MSIIIESGATNQSINLRMVDSTAGTPEIGVTSATAGLDVWYRRELAAKVSLTESDLTALTDAHSDGGLFHIADGVYRIDFPDAAFAAGVDRVQVGWAATGMVGQTETVALNIASTTDIKTQATLALSDSGIIVISTTIATAPSQTQLTLTSGSDDDDAYNGMTAVIIDASTGTQRQLAIPSDYEGSTKTITLSAEPGVFNYGVGDTITFLPVPTLAHSRTSALQSSNTFLQLQQHGLFFAYTSIATVTSQTIFTLSGTSGDTPNDQLNGMVATIYKGIGANDEWRKCVVEILDYVGGTTPIVTLKEAPANYTIEAGDLIDFFIPKSTTVRKIKSTSGGLKYITGGGVTGDVWGPE